MKHIEINGQEILISKGSSEARINDESIGNIIAKALPNSMEQFKDYVCNIKVSIDVFGADGNDLEILKDFKEVVIND